MRDSIENLLVEVVGEGARVGIARIRKSKFCAEEVAGAETGIDGNQLLKAAKHKRTEKYNHHGDGDFSDDENGVAALMCAVAAITGTQGIDERQRRAGRRQNSKEKCGHGADDHCEEQYRDVEVDGLEERRIDAVSVRERDTHEGKSDGREGYSECSAEQGKEECLNEELAEEARAVGTECLPDGNVAPGLGGSHEEEIRDIHAGDEKYQNNRTHQAEHCRAERADKFGVQRHERDALVAVVAGVSGSDALRDRLHIGARCGESNAGTETAQHFDGMPDTGCLRRLIKERERKPDFAVGGEGSVRREHADDRVGSAIERYRPANGAGVTTEIRGPGGCTEHSDLVFAGSVILFVEEAACEW